MNSSIIEQPENNVKKKTMLNQTLLYHLKISKRVRSLTLNGKSTKSFGTLHFAIIIYEAGDQEDSTCSYMSVVTLRYCDNICSKDTYHIY